MRGRGAALGGGRQLVSTLGGPRCRSSAQSPDGASNPGSPRPPGASHKAQLFPVPPQRGPRVRPDTLPGGGSAVQSSLGVLRAPDRWSVPRLPLHKPHLRSPDPSGWPPTHKPFLLQFEIRQLRAHLAQQDLDLAAEREAALRAPQVLRPRGRYHVVEDTATEGDAEPLQPSPGRPPAWGAPRLRPPGVWSFVPSSDTLVSSWLPFCVCLRVLAEWPHVVGARWHPSGQPGVPRGCGCGCPPVALAHP